jgi:predicted phosphodiesterase
MNPKPWQDVWPQVLKILGSPDTIKGKTTAVSKLRGQDTTWEAIKRARRRYGSGVAPKATPRELGGIGELKLPTIKVKKPGKPTHKLQAKSGDIWGYASDIHFGIEDKPALEAMLDCWEYEGVTKAILGGDIFDCYSLSRYDHVPYPKREVYNVEDEAKRAGWFWARLKSLGCEVHFLPGNHEDRIYSLEKNNPGLVNSVSVRDMLRIPEWVQVHPQNGRLLAGDLVIEHGHKLPGSLSTNGAAKVLRDHPYQTTVYGHTHRVESKMHTVHMPGGEPRVFGAYSIGHLSIAEHHIDYSPDASWQTGFALIHWREGSHGVTPVVEPVVIADEGFVAAGVSYKL